MKYNRPKAPTAALQLAVVINDDQWQIFKSHSSTDGPAIQDTRSNMRVFKKKKSFIHVKGLLTALLVPILVFGHQTRGRPSSVLVIPKIVFPRLEEDQQERMVNRKRAPYPISSATMSPPLPPCSTLTDPCNTSLPVVPQYYRLSQATHHDSLTTIHDPLVAIRIEKTDHGIGSHVIVGPMGVGSRLRSIRCLR